MKPSRPYQDYAPVDAPQIVVVRFQEHVDFPAGGAGQVRLDQLRIGPWRELDARFGHLTLRPLFTSLNAAQITGLQRRAIQIDPTYRPTRLTGFFYIDAPAGTDLQALVKELNTWPWVERAYIDAPGPDPVTASDDPRSENQGYLNAAPEGIDARYAWTIPGGDGVGQRVVDLERGWTLDHEDLAAQEATLIYGVIRDESRSHGTSVLGELCAVDNTIGCVGIVPNLASVGVVSYHLDTRPNAILAALPTMTFGDVLLIEAQVLANPGVTGLLGPIEIYDADFEVLRLATALGIVVVEAGGNGTDNGSAPAMDMDTWTDNAGRRLLFPSTGNPDFRDSGAIIVTAATAAAPHTRRAYGPFGQRIDCYAWSQQIDTCASDAAGATTLYTTGFSGTSGASPIVTGAALAIQGMYQAAHGIRLSPWQIREILRDPALNTQPAATETAAIGVMPDLRRIIDERLELVPDIYIRDHIGDTGTPHAGPISASPDIILRPSPVADPQAAFGEGSGTENDATLGAQAEAGQPNYIYVRVLNRGGADAVNVTARVFWAPVATLVTADLWTEVGAAIIPSVPMGEQVMVSDAITWPAAAIPGPGHYCFVGLVGTAGDPAPSPADFLNFDNFRLFIRQNNNVTWRNFNVVDSEPDPAIGFVPMPFLMPGAPDRRVRMRLAIDARLPRRARLFLEAPINVIELLGARSPAVIIDPQTQLARLPLPTTGQYPFREFLFPARARFPMRLLAHLPEEDRDRRYRVSARQLYGHEEVGRVTWELAPLDGKPTYPGGKGK